MKIAIKSIQYQKGYAILITSLFILFATSLIVLYSTRSSIAEEKISANDYKVRTTFEAAEAGSEFGIAYLKQNFEAIIVDKNKDGFIDKYVSNDITNIPLVNSTKFTVNYTNPIANDYTLIQITSTGKSADDTVSRTITQLLEFNSYLKSNIPAPFIARKKVDLSGNLKISNPNGTTIWSGEGTTLEGSAKTDGNGVSSDKNGINSDVVANDTNLSKLTSDEFFQAVFGTTTADAEQYADTVYNNSGNTHYAPLLDKVTGKVIWINQTGGDAILNSNMVVGSATEPVIIIINGNLSIQGNATVYGMIYITNSNNQWINNGGGNLTVHGSMVVAGDAQSTGNPTVAYDPTIIDKAKKLGNYTKVPGTWHDF